MNADTIALFSSVASGASAVIAVLLALIAVPRAFWRAADERRKAAAALFYECQRGAIASGLSLIKTIEDWEAKIIAFDRSDPSTDFRVSDIISVEMSFDAFRSEFDRCFDLCERAGDHISRHDVLALLRLKNHVHLIADVQGEKTSEEEGERYKKKLGYEYDELCYKAWVIARMLEDMDKRPTFARLLKRYPTAGFAFDYEYEQKRKPSAQTTE